MEGVDTLMMIQVVYLLVIFLILRSTIRKKKSATFYWFVIGAYLVTMIWLVSAYFEMPKHDGGQAFGIGMYSILIPGALTLASMAAFLINGGKKKNFS